MSIYQQKGGTPALTTFLTLPEGESFLQNSSTIGIDGPGYSLGNTGGWSVTGGSYLNIAVSRRGITQIRAGVINKHGVGDVAGTYHYVHHDGGMSAASDEGATAMSAQCLEYPEYFTGTVASTKGQGDRLPVLAFTSGEPHTSDGAFLLNITKGTISGNLNGPSQPVTLTAKNGSSATYLNALPVTNKLPVSSAIGIMVGSIPNQNTTRDDPKEVTLTVQLVAISAVYKAFAAGVVTVAGDQPEQAIITTASKPNSDGLQTLTLSVANPASQAVLFQGGIQGQFLSFDANDTMSSYFAFGSLTGSDLIYGVNVCGGIAGNTLPHHTGEKAQTSGPASGYHLYPGAEVVRNFSQGFDCQLEANGVSWAVGDVVANPHYPVGGGTTAYFIRYQKTPNSPKTGLMGLALELDGPGISGGNSWGVKVMNAHSAKHPEDYVDGGGTLVPPVGFGLMGAWAHSFYIEQAPMPGTSIFWLANQNKAKTDITQVLNLGWTAQGGIYFTQSLGRWTITGEIDAQNGFAVNHQPGWNGTYPTADGRTVTVSGGIIIKCE